VAAIETSNPFERNKETSLDLTIVLCEGPWYCTGRSLGATMNVSDLRNLYKRVACTRSRASVTRSHGAGNSIATSHKRTATSPQVPSRVALGETTGNKYWTGVDARQSQFSHSSLRHDLASYSLARLRLSLRSSAVVSEFHCQKREPNNVLSQNKARVGQRLGSDVETSRESDLE